MAEDRFTDRVTVDDILRHAEQSAKRRIHRRGMLATAILLLALVGALVWWVWR